MNYRKIQAEIKDVEELIVTALEYCMVEEALKLRTRRNALIKKLEELN